MSAEDPALDDGAEEAPRSALDAWLRSASLLMLMFGIPLALVEAFLVSLAWLTIAFYAGAPIFFVWLLSHFAAKRSGEVERITLVSTLMLASVTWLIYLTVAAGLLILAVLVATLPPMHWRRWALLSWGGLLMFATAFNPMIGWKLERCSVCETWLLYVHVTMLLLLVGLFAARPASGVPKQPEPRRPTSRFSAE